jgi:hypothetical protein
MRNNGSRRLRTQVETTTKRGKGQALSLLSEGCVTGRRFLKGQTRSSTVGRAEPFQLALNCLRTKPAS